MSNHAAPGQEAREALPMHQTTSRQRKLDPDRPPYARPLFMQREREYWQAKITRFVTDLKRLWAAFKSILGRQSSSGIASVTPAFSAEDFAKHYSGKIFSVQANTLDSSSGVSSHLPPVRAAGGDLSCRAPLFSLGLRADVL